MRIIFAYTGYEQETWGDIAFRKETFYHYLPGILYLEAAVRHHPRLAEQCSVSALHFNTTVQSREEILEELAEHNPDCVGFACYCWNLDLHIDLARDLKRRFPSVRVIFGGPEICMKTPKECASFFERAPDVDLLVFGEAETRIGDIVDSLMKPDVASLARISGVTLNPRLGDVCNPETEPVECLARVPSIFPRTIEVQRSPQCGLFVVYEASRGCPNKCIYCEFVRRRTKQDEFPLERVQREIRWLLEQQVDGIHFADAVFDRNPSFTKEVLATIIQSNTTSSILCYCSFATLDRELVDLFEESQCQIGVGVQSTDPQVLRRLRRSLSSRLFSEGKELLRGRAVNFYTDLMFGLPGDSLKGFSRSFNDILGLSPAFMMLFPLSLIRGTQLGDNPEKYHVRHIPDEQLRKLDLQCGIEYLKVGLGQGFETTDLERFDDVALACFYFYTRFPFCLRHLINIHRGGGFDLFARLGELTKSFLARIGRQAGNQDNIEGFQEEIASIFHKVLVYNDAGPNESAAFETLFKIDIFRMLVMRAPQRAVNYSRAMKTAPHAEIPAALDPSMKLVPSTFGKTVVLEYSFPDLKQLHHLRESITPTQSTVLIHAPFNRASADVVVMSDEALHCYEFISGRGIPRLGAMVSSLRSVARKMNRSPYSLEEIRDIVEMFQRRGIARLLILSE